MDIWQAINSTPFSMAWRRNDSNESIPLRFMIWRIIRAPMPPIFIFESFSFMESDSNIMPNIFPNQSFSTFGFSVFLMAFNPQSEENGHFLSVAAAPLAKTKVANALSKSSLNKIKVLPLPSSPK